MAVAMNGTSKRTFRKSYSIEHGYKARRRSLIADAEFDREQHDEEEQQQKQQQEAIPEEDQKECNYAILVTTKDKNTASILHLINILNRDGLKVEHLETRPVVPSSTTQEKLSDGTFSILNIEFDPFMVS